MGPSDANFPHCRNLGEPQSAVRFTIGSGVYLDFAFCVEACRFISCNLQPLQFLQPLSGFCCCEEVLPLRHMQNAPRRKTETLWTIPPENRHPSFERFL